MKSLFFILYIDKKVIQLYRLLTFFLFKTTQGFKVNDEGDVANFAKIMMATSDFDVFMMLMRETAETWRKNNPKSNKK
tara:strand:- start:16 stop:249 length:234 start_codon:yes stop_codon:yes gene_type:complete